MDELSIDTAKKYLEAEKCPQCKSDRLTWDGYDVNEDTRDVHCNACGLDFYEIYSKIGIGVRGANHREYVPGNYYIRARDRISNVIQEYGPYTKARLPYVEHALKRTHYIIELVEK